MSSTSTTVQDRAEGAVLPHNQRAAAMWSSGGGEYDQLSRSIADAIQHCVLRLDATPGERVLDLATGTGWTSRAVARTGAAVTGADIANGLLASARERARAEGLDITYRLGDAEQLPFDDGEFDAVVSTFGVMFASRPEAAAAEIARVTRKGGRVALATWLPDGNVFKMFVVMKPYMQAPIQPAPPSPFEWGRPERIRELMGSAFDLRFETGVSFYRDRSGEAAWNMISAGYGPTKALAASLDEARGAAFRRDFIDFHDSFRTELGISMPRDYLVSVGVRR